MSKLHVVAPGLLALFGASCQTIPTPPSAPSVSTTMTRVGAADSLTAAFTATATDPDGGQVSYLWDFTDGTTTAEQNPTHTFPSAGNRRISLTVTDDQGMATLLTLSLTVPLVGGPISGGERTVPNEGNLHVAVGTAVTFQTNPPASGSHYSAQGVAPLAAGLYRASDGVRPEQWIHNLEHGYVVYLYECNGECMDAFLNQLQALFDATGPSKFGNKKLVIAPYAGLGPFVMAVAWDVQQDFDTLDTGGLTAFYERHVDRGPESTP